MQGGPAGRLVDPAAVGAGPYHDKTELSFVELPRPRHVGDRYRRVELVAAQAHSQGTGTPWISTGCCVGSNSTVWSTPTGVITSTAFGTVLG